MSEVSLETKQYLNSIATRVSNYYHAISKTRQFLINNQVYDPDIAVNCTIMSILWAAAVRGDVVTEQDLLTFLGFEENTSSDVSVALAPDMHSWSLDDVLEYVIKHS